MFMGDILGATRIIQYINTKIHSFTIYYLINIWSVAGCIIPLPCYEGEVVGLQRCLCR